MRAVVPVVALARARRVLAHPHAVVLVDGRSGSGKTTFAAALAAGSGARLLRLDDLHQGWDGLRAASDAVLRDVLVPRRAALAGWWTGWDWAAGRAAGGGAVPADGPLVVEGCGVLTRASARLATLRIWVELDAASRRQRALERDGEVFRPHWDRWAAQEAAVIAREDPRRLADLVVDGRRFPGTVFSARTGNAH